MTRPPIPRTRPTPTTRHSLLVRLRDRDDQQAWNEFFEIYHPVLYRMARARGFQDADALELAQEVLLSVSRAIDSYSADREGASFRGWLSRITKNQALNRLRKVSASAPGGSTFARRLSEIAGPTPERTDELEFEYERRRQSFIWASNQLEKRFSTSNWQAFWLTCVEGVSAEDAAKRLEISVGMVYVARCRVIARLREMVQRLTEDAIQ